MVRRGMRLPDVPDSMERALGDLHLARSALRGVAVLSRGRVPLELTRFLEGAVVGVTTIIDSWGRYGELGGTNGEALRGPAAIEALGALAELVRLKDGPRDAGYRAAKDEAWRVARRLVVVSPEPIPPQDVERAARLVRDRDWARATREP